MSNLTNTITKWISDQIIRKKLNSPLGYLVVILMALFVSLIVSKLGLLISSIFAILVVGAPLVLAAIFYIEIGLMISLSVAFLVPLIVKYGNMPIGILLDAFVVYLMLAVVINQIKIRDWSFCKSPITVWILIWIFYNIFLLINPWAQSHTAWFFTVRSLAILNLFFFPAAFALNSLHKITSMLKFIMFWGFIATCYGLKQEWFGFSSQELVWLYSDEKRLQLILQWSRLRIFSFFSDPTSYGILLSYLSVMLMVFCLGPYKLIKKVYMGITILLMFLAMGYAGSRTPFVLVPSGIVFLTIMTLNKQIIAGAVFFMLLGTGFVMSGSLGSNPVLYRIQSAFNPKTSGDTMEVRDDNRRYFQPYIYRYPFGMGLGSVGDWGKRFSPDSPIAQKPHDSGYLRMAVELGVIGLIIYIIMLFVTIREGVYYYYRVKNPRIKNYYLAISTMMFMLIVATYPQEAIILLPTSLIFYIMQACLVRLKDFDENFHDQSKFKQKVHYTWESDFSKGGVPEPSKEDTGFR